MSTRNEISDLSYEELETQLKAVFDRPSYVTNVTDRLMTLRQGARSVAQFTVEFWTLVVEVGWNESPLMGVFRRGLNRQLQEAALLWGHPKDLDSLISLATELDTYLYGQHWDPTVITSSLLPSHPPAPPGSTGFHSAELDGYVSSLHDRGRAPSAGSGPTHSFSEAKMTRLQGVPLLRPVR